MDTIFLDIETNLSWDTIWVVVTKRPGEEALQHFGPATLPSPTEYNYVAHNGVSFDFPLLSKLWGWTVPIENQSDSLLFGKLLDPNIPGGHSLRAWGERLKLLEGKGEYPLELFDAGYTTPMGYYCVRDVEVLEQVYNHIMAALDTLRFSASCTELEHRVRHITNAQEKNGFMLDVPGATELWTELTCRQHDIEEELQKVFPPIVTPRWSDKTGKRLMCNVEVFNVGSRPQIARRLEGLGVRWKKKTEKGNIIVDEATLSPLADKYPEAALILEYLKAGKRASMVNGWLEAVKDDGRVYGRVDTLGAITGRMTHSKPNLAQVERGESMRRLWRVEDDNLLVGIDAASLELRMLAHYMNDEEYIEQVIHGDIHTVNQQAAGLATRDEAKTFIYAFLYGAGDAKIGSIAGGGAAKGRALKEVFLMNTPALRELREKVQRVAEQGHLPGLDGRRLRVRSKHSALNTLLQGAGAIIMKRALVIACEQMDGDTAPYKLVAQVHDEVQFEVPDRKWAEYVGDVFVGAIREAGRYYDMRCPLDGKAHIGKTWAETH